MIDPGHKLGSVVVRELCPLLSGLVCIGTSLRHTVHRSRHFYCGTVFQNTFDKQLNSLLFEQEEEIHNSVKNLSFVQRTEGLLQRHPRLPAVVQV